MSTEKVVFGLLKLVSNRNYSLNATIDRCPELGGITRQGLCKFICKQTMENENPFHDCYQKLIQHIDKQYYWNASKGKKCAQQRILAIDGKTIRLDKRNSSGYTNLAKKSKNRNFANAYMHTLFDVILGIAIDVEIKSDNNERKYAKDLITNSCRKGDILIMDRGYYSSDCLSIA
jgi:hypothetical protein